MGILPRVFSACQVSRWLPLLYELLLFVLGFTVLVWTLGGLHRGSDRIEPSLGSLKPDKRVIDKPISREPLSPKALRSLRHLIGC